MFVCCDAEDYTRGFQSSEMYRIIDKHANSILLFVTVPPPPRRVSQLPNQQKHNIDDQSSDSTISNTNDGQKRLQKSMLHVHAYAYTVELLITDPPKSSHLQYHIFSLLGAFRL